MSKERFEDPFNPFSPNYNGEPVGPDSFGGSDEGSHNMVCCGEKRHPDLADPEDEAILREIRMKIDSEVEKSRQAELENKVKAEKMNENHGWIQVYTGKKFHPLHPKEENITIRDIAHSLANMCRFTGHCKKFYSVAQHCVLASYLVDEHFALATLLHDASEAYLVDIPKPLKRLPIFEGYRELEHNLQNIIFEKFGWFGGETPEIKKADVAMLATEARDLMAPLHLEWVQPTNPLPFTITPVNPQEAERLYLERFKELILSQIDGAERYNSFIGE